MDLERSKCSGGPYRRPVQPGAEAVRPLSLVEQLEEVRKGVERIVQESEALRSVKLDNGDEPLSLFRPYRAEEK